ncbi:unnamed protein product [Adineta steineri]|uniref:Uncharacterized protein n=1 Tax=Adineta steineri TaxID=433720 RepID=A0A814FEN2_9BILA|nr:unnamed protein product [Adineta steineri]CAF3645959.1 unnamed protein product [Adineta steineri]
MSSANSFLPSTTYHTSNNRYSTPQTTTTTSSSSSSFNILSNSVQQQLNDLNSTRSSTSCSTSHCLSNQCLECTTILSTRPSQPRCNLNSYIDSSSNSSHFVQNCSYVTNSTLDNHSQVLAIDDQQTTTTRVLSMNIPVDNSNNVNPINSSSLNIEIEEEEDDDDDDDHHRQTHLCNEHIDQNEQLEVFVGFYRPGEYQRETMEDDDDDDDDESELSRKSDTQKKEEQSTRELISDEDEGNEDQDFIDEDFGPNQDDDTDQQQQDNEIINEEQLHPNILDNDQPQQQAIELNEPILFPIVIVQIDEDEDQGFGAQFNDDCQSSDDENNHLSTISLNNTNNENELAYSKKKFLQRSQSDTELNHRKSQIYLSLPSLTINSDNQYEKFEHIIIDDQQPLTTMSNLLIKKKQDNDDNEYLFLRKKKILRKSSEEIIEISNQESPLQTIVDEAVRDVERHVMLWDDEHARQIDTQSSLQQIVQYFQLNIDINQDQQSRILSIRKELLLDYLQYRSETDISASDLHENLLQYPEYSSRIHCRFFPFWPPRDVDLLQWLSHWIKQGALPIAIMNMDHTYSQRSNYSNTISSWQHRIIYGVEPRAIYLMNPIQMQSPQQVYEQLTIDSITYITRHEIVQRYNQSPMCLTPLAINNNKSRLFSDTRWRTMNVLGQVVNVLREDRQLHENETRNIPYRPTVTHVRIPSTCSSGILIFSKDYNQLLNAIDLPLRQ